MLGPMETAHSPSTKPSPDGVWSSVGRLAYVSEFHHTFARQHAARGDGAQRQQPRENGVGSGCIDEAPWRDHIVQSIANQWSDPTEYANAGVIRDGNTRPTHVHGEELNHPQVDRSGECQE